MLGIVRPQLAGLRLGILRACRLEDGIVRQPFDDDDAVVFARLFVADPDLVDRFSSGAPLNTLDPGTLYTPGAAGYTDYPGLKPTREPQRA